MKDTQIWTKSNSIKERTDEELQKRKTVMHCGGVKWADDKEEKVEEYKLGRAVGEAIREESAERESDNMFVMEEEKERPGILHIQDGSEKHVH